MGYSRLLEYILISVFLLDSITKSSHSPKSIIKSLFSGLIFCRIFPNSSKDHIISSSNGIFFPLLQILRILFSIFNGSNKITSLRLKSKDNKFFKFFPGLCTISILISSSFVLKSELKIFSFSNFGKYCFPTRIFLSSSLIFCLISNHFFLNSSFDNCFFPIFIRSLLKLSNSFFKCDNFLFSIKSSKNLILAVQFFSLLNISPILIPIIC